MMRLPRKETLVYLKEINDWIASEEIVSDGVILVFKKGVPSDVIGLFEKIKDKLDFKIKFYYKNICLKGMSVIVFNGLF